MDIPDRSARVGRSIAATLAGICGVVASWNAYSLYWHRLPRWLVEHGDHPLTAQPIVAVLAYVVCFAIVYAILWYRADRAWWRLPAARLVKRG